MDRFLQGIVDRIGWRAYLGLLYGSGFSVAIVISYASALLGEPHAYWLWHSILGLI